MPETRVPVEEMQSQFDEWIRRVEEGEQALYLLGVLILPALSQYNEFHIRIFHRISPAS
jgi:hypothetical protein